MSEEDKNYGSLFSPSYRKPIQSIDQFAEICLGVPKSIEDYLQPILYSLQSWLKEFGEQTDTDAESSQADQNARLKEYVSLAIWRAKFVLKHRDNLDLDCVVFLVELGQYLKLIEIHCYEELLEREQQGRKLGTANRSQRGRATRESVLEHYRIIKSAHPTWKFGEVVRSIASKVNKSESRVRQILGKQGITSRK